jgi:hypothetical protein
MHHSLGESRRECKTIRIRNTKIRDAVIELAEYSEAMSLVTHELETIEFILSVVIWYQVLTKINIVSKNLQKVDMQLGIAIVHLKAVKTLLALK